MLAEFLNDQADLQVIATAATKDRAIAFCADNQVDVVLMDINLTGNNLDGIEATLELNLTAIYAETDIIRPILRVDRTELDRLRQR